ncbi:MAG: SUMF1/EgtB/PvdO family nonheme iron enzyme [Candidatus Hydrogenedentes bacterium]|nr:SUMF1/EgtB/PvdO family nonheme iron enzyme [Candidatus Hydrogenedentota bacterium]
MVAEGDHVPDHDVFISHSHHDQAAAHAIGNALESRQIRCWMAPRDVPPGATWSAAITGAISECQMMVLVFSSHSNHSGEVLREVTCAVDNGVVIIPFRIEDVEMSKDMKYFLAPLHWLDALTPPLAQHVAKLAQRVESLLLEKGRVPAKEPSSGAEDAASPHAEEAPPPRPSGNYIKAFLAAARFLLSMVCLLGHCARTLLAAARSLPAMVRSFGNRVRTLPSAARSLFFSPRVRTGFILTVVFLVLLGTASYVFGWSARHAGEESIFDEIRMVWIPPGEFMMSSPESEPERDGNERPLHRVAISRGFWLGKYEVTQAQWQAVMAGAPSKFKGDTLPVECVSWDDCHEFIWRLNAKGEGLFRLPTEAEWEYACRAGTTTPFAFGETISPEQANYNGDGTYWNGREGVYRQQTTPVGSFRPNAWGLYDMHGNVCEWCQDWWHDTYQGAPEDGSAWESPAGERRVLRGGSWDDTLRNCRSAAREPDTPGSRHGALGFRVVRTP